MNGTDTYKMGERLIQKIGY